MRFCDLPLTATSYRASSSSWVRHGVNVLFRLCCSACLGSLKNEARSCEVDGLGRRPCGLCLYGPDLAKAGGVCSCQRSQISVLNSMSGAGPIESALLGLTQPESQYVLRSPDHLFTHYVSHHVGCFLAYRSGDHCAGRGHTSCLGYSSERTKICGASELSFFPALVAAPRAQWAAGRPWEHALLFVAGGQPVPRLWRGPHEGPHERLPHRRPPARVADAHEQPGRGAEEGRAVLLRAQVRSAGVGSLSLVSGLGVIGRVWGLASCPDLGLHLRAWLVVNPNLQKGFEKFT